MRFVRIWQDRGKDMEWIKTRWLAEQPEVEWIQPDEEQLRAFDDSPKKNTSDDDLDDY